MFFIVFSYNLINNYNLTVLSQHLRESGHTHNWEDVEILAKIENNIVEQKFKEIVAITQEKKNSLLNKKEERNISDI